MRVRNLASAAPRPCPQFFGPAHCGSACERWAARTSACGGVRGNTLQLGRGTFSDKLPSTSAKVLAAVGGRPLSSASAASSTAEEVEIFEVGPRDGLQNEDRHIATEQKVALVDMLTQCGYRRIEVASFVSPKWVPQMADSAEVLSQINRGKNVSYAALTPNSRGFEDALVARASEVAIFAAASEGFSQANLNCSVEESLQRFAPVVDAANTQGIPVRGYISCVVSCPYDGATPPGAVASLASKMYEDFGCYEISLGDTVGTGTPEEIGHMLDAVLQVAPPKDLAGHYHNTAGRALQNISVSLEKGIRVFDASVGGLGGCPYAPGAAGNVATESVIAHVHSLGFSTGLDVAAVADAAAFARSLVAR